MTALLIVLLWAFAAIFFVVLAGGVRRGDSSLDRASLATQLQNAAAADDPPAEPTVPRAAPPLRPRPPADATRRGALSR